MKKICTFEFKGKKLIKRAPLNKYLNEDISIQSKDNQEISTNNCKHYYCQNLGKNKETNDIKKSIDFRMKGHKNIKNEKIEKIINLDSNENSLDENINEVIEILESDNKNLSNNLYKEIKLEENNDIITLSNNDEDDNNDGIKKINIISKQNIFKKDRINENNFKKNNFLNNNDEFHGINKKINNIEQLNNYKYQNYFKKIKNKNKYTDNYDKKNREKEIKGAIKRVDLSISDNKFRKKKYEKNSIQNNNISLSPELCLFYFLLEEYGIENVIDSIYDSEENKNKKKNLDLCLQVIKQIYGENKLIVMAVQAAIFIMKNDSNKIFIKNKINGLNNDKDKEDEYKNIDMNTHNSNIFENNIISEKNEKSISIISHYNRYKDKKIYKYRAGHLLGKLVIFYCFDKKCESIGIFNLETKSFRLKKAHNLKHSKHDYIINYDKNRDYIFEEMIEKNYCDCQIFKENQVMIVRYYN